MTPRRRIATLASASVPLLALLAACGGGGGSDSANPPAGGGGGIGVGGDGALTLGASAPLPAPWERAGTEPVWADFDGDGRADFAVGLRVSDPRLSFLPEWSGIALFFGKGDGTFEAAAFEPLPDMVTRFGFLLLQPGDFDGDGALDLVALPSNDSESEMISRGVAWRSRAAVLRNLGARAFAYLPTVDLASIPSTGVHAAAVADFDEDGADDLVVTEPDLFDSWVGTGAIYGLRIFLADDVAGFELAPYGQLPALFGTSALRTGDFDGDGHADVANVGVDMSPVGGATKVATIWIGLGDATLVWAGDVDIGPRVDKATVADFDGDGTSDFALTSVDGGLMTWLGSVGATPEAYLASALYAGTLVALATGDLDGDGRADLVALGTGLDPLVSTPTLSVFLGDVDGSLRPGSPASYAVPTGAITLAVVDLDGDGALDAVFMNADTGEPVPLFGHPD